MKPGSYLLLATIMVGIIFAADLYIPLGVAFGVSYIIVILIALQTPYRHAFIIAAVICTLLVLLGLVFSPEGGEAWKVYFNRAIAVFAIWLIVLQGLIKNELNNELTEANKKLELLSRIDGLTGLANRRFMDEFIDKEWLRAIRKKLYISFILIDIDFFKLYNDNYGHPEGDECLKKVATELKSLALRPGDLVARYGGEEFALVLADTEEAETVANICRQSIKELQIPHEFSEAADVVTISVGFYSVAPEKGTDPSMIIDAADKALYKAKEGGRDRVEQITPHS